VRLANLITGTTAKVAQNAWTLAWPRADRLLLGLNARVGDRGQLEYDTNWLNPNTGAIGAVPRLDNVSVFAMPRDASRVIAATPDTGVDDGLFILSAYDLDSGTDTPIGKSPEGVTDKGGAEIQSLGLSQDRTRIYWATYIRAPITSPPAVSPVYDIYMAQLDGSSSARVGEVSGYLMAVSGDGLIASSDMSPASAAPGTIKISDLSTGATTSLRPGQLVAAWRPPPAP